MEIRWRGLILIPLLIFLASLTIPASSRTIPISKRAAFYIANETVCNVDGVLYKNGDPIPTDNVCETCKCRPPGFACVLKECDLKPHCKAIRREGQCCPDYQCGCEHDGNLYNDGDIIPNPESPCYTCYCQGSSIACSLVNCRFRSDCEPKYVAGECCPRYDHCPPLQEPTYPTSPAYIPSTSPILTSTETPYTTTYYGGYSTVSQGIDTSSYPTSEDSYGGHGTSSVPSSDYTSYYSTYPASSQETSDVPYSNPTDYSSLPTSTEHPSSSSSLPQTTLLDDREYSPPASETSSQAASTTSSEPASAHASEAPESSSTPSEYQTTFSTSEEASSSQSPILPAETLAASDPAPEPTSEPTSEQPLSPSEEPAASAYTQASFSSQPTTVENSAETVVDVMYEDDVQDDLHDHDAPVVQPLPDSYENSSKKGFFNSEEPPEEAPAKDEPVVDNSPSTERPSEVPSTQPTSSGESTVPVYIVTEETEAPEKEKDESAATTTQQSETVEVTQPSLYGTASTQQSSTASEAPRVESVSTLPSSTASESSEKGVPSKESDSSETKEEKLEEKSLSRDPSSSSEENSKETSEESSEEEANKNTDNELPVNGQSSNESEATDNPVPEVTSSEKPESNEKTVENVNGENNEVKSSEKDVLKNSADEQNVLEASAESQKNNEVQTTTEGKAVTESVQVTSENSLNEQNPDSLIDTAQGDQPASEQEASKKQDEADREDNLKVRNDETVLNTNQESTTAAPVEEEKPKESSSTTTTTAASSGAEETEPSNLGKKVDEPLENQEPIAEDVLVSRNAPTLGQESATSPSSEPPTSSSVTQDDRVPVQEEIIVPEVAFTVGGETVAIPTQETLPQEVSSETQTENEKSIEQQITTQSSEEQSNQDKEEKIQANTDSNIEVAEHRNVESSEASVNSNEESSESNPQEEVSSAASSEASTTEAVEVTESNKEVRKNDPDVSASSAITEEVIKASSTTSAALETTTQAAQLLKNNDIPQGDEPREPEPVLELENDTNKSQLTESPKEQIKPSTESSAVPFSQEEPESTKPAGMETSISFVTSISSDDVDTSASEDSASSNSNEESKQQPAGTTPLIPPTPQSLESSSAAEVPDLYSPEVSSQSEKEPEVSNEQPSSTTVSEDSQTSLAPVSEPPKQPQPVQGLNENESSSAAPSNVDAVSEAVPSKEGVSESESINIQNDEPGESSSETSVESSTKVSEVSEEAEPIFRNAATGQPIIPDEKVSEATEKPAEVSSTSLPPQETTPDTSNIQPQASETLLTQALSEDKNLIEDSKSESASSSAVTTATPEEMTEPTIPPCAAAILSQYNIQLPHLLIPSRDPVFKMIHASTSSPAITSPAATQQTTASSSEAPSTSTQPDSKLSIQKELQEKAFDKFLEDEFDLKLSEPEESKEAAENQTSSAVQSDERASSTAQPPVTENQRNELLSTPVIKLLKAELEGKSATVTEPSETTQQATSQSESHSTVSPSTTAESLQNVESSSALNEEPVSSQTNTEKIETKEPFLSTSSPEAAEATTTAQQPAI